MTAHLLTLAWIGAILWPALALYVRWRSKRFRRFFVVRALTVLITAAWGVCVWAFLVEPRLLVVKELEVATEKWRAPPLRIGVAADVHVGAHMSPARVRNIVERMNALEPDVVLLLGDYVSGHVGPDARSARENAMIGEGLAALGGFEAPLGVYAVLGNHDWWYHGPHVESVLDASGVGLLENSWWRVPLGEAEADTVWLVGLADDASLRTEPDWSRALADVPADASTIAIAHRPDVFFDAPDNVALTLTGHSHCGQIHPPFLPRPAISRGAARWPCGLYEEEGRLMFVSGGLGVSVLPARFRAPPEIVVLTLTGEDARRLEPSDGLR